MTPRLLPVLPIMIVAFSCAPVVEEHDEEEHEPTDEDIDYLRAGTIDCTRSSDTGYRGGGAFSIDVVTVDGTISGARGSFVLSYTFNRIGARSLRAEALDASGAVVASHRVDVIVF
jgi:hypothetical protein